MSTREDWKSDFREKYTFMGRNQGDQVERLFKLGLAPETIEGYIESLLAREREETVEKCKLAVPPIISKWGESDEKVLFDESQVEKFREETLKSLSALGEE